MRIKRKSQTLAAKLKQQFEELNNLLSIKDTKEELMGKLKNHIGKADEDLRKIISKL
jgi:uncharacterized protein YjbJ (UPF0337 family)